MRALVYVEWQAGGVAAASLKAVTAARACGGEIDLLLSGEGEALQAAAEAARGVAGVARVLVADGPAYAHALAEPVAALVTRLAGEGYSHVLAAATSCGKSFMPRVAAGLNVAQISEISAVLGADTFQRPIYAGNALATVRALDPIKVLTVRTTAFEAAGNGGAAELVRLEAPAPAPLRARFEGQALSASARPELTAARVIVSGGRGMQSSENFALLDRLADRLGAAVGASRAAVDAGFAPNDLQVGQTGKIVAPELYIAVGISGAIQHLAGMKDSRVIVAINKDEEAPIFQVADYGIVGDLFQLVPEIAAELERQAS